MSLCIDIEKFPNMSAVLKEVERQRNLRIFSAIAPDQTNIHKPLTRTMSTSRPEALNKHQNAKRQASDPSNSRRNRLSSTPCSTIDHWKPKFDGRLTAAAKNWAKRSFVCWKKTFLSQWTFSSSYARYERRLWVVTSYFSKSAVVGYKCWRLIKKLLILAGRCTVKTTIKTFDDIFSLLWLFFVHTLFQWLHVVYMTIGMYSIVKAKEKEKTIK